MKISILLGIYLILNGRRAWCSSPIGAYSMSLAFIKPQRFVELYQQILQNISEKNGGISMKFAKIKFSKDILAL